MLCQLRQRNQYFLKLCIGESLYRLPKTKGYVRFVTTYPFFVEKGTNFALGVQFEMRWITAVILRTDSMSENS